MRTAALCPTCATYTNSICVIYNGEYLPNIEASPMDPLDTILLNLDDTLGGIDTSITNINNDITTINNEIDGFYPLYGSGVPTMDSSYVGQIYIDITAGQLFYSISTGSSTTWNTVCLCTPISARIFDDTFDLTFN